MLNNLAIQRDSTSSIDADSLKDKLTSHAQCVITGARQTHARTFPPCNAASVSGDRLYAPSLLTAYRSEPRSLPSTYVPSCTTPQSPVRPSVQHARKHARIVT
jgi:hypothetical protein